MRASRIALLLPALFATLPGCASLIANTTYVENGAVPEPFAGVRLDARFLRSGHNPATGGVPEWMLGLGDMVPSVALDALLLPVSVPAHFLRRETPREPLSESLPIY